MWAVSSEIMEADEGLNICKELSAQSVARNGSFSSLHYNINFFHILFGTRGDSSLTWINGFLSTELSRDPDDECKWGENFPAQ